MANLIKKIRTDAGDVQIDYNALANLPSINNNLLINGNFSINQRGSTSYIQTNTWKYSVDRWKYVGIMGVTVNESGTVSISKTNNSDDTYFVQQLEDIYGSGDFTFSFYVKSIDGTLEAYIEGSGGKIISVQTAGIHVVKSSSGAKGVVFRLKGATANVELSWAKLESGSEATPFMPRLRGEELVLCQRYFNVISGVRVMGAEQSNENHLYTFSIPMEIKNMRAKPNVSTAGTTTANSANGICIRSTSTAVLTGFSFTYGVRASEVLVTAVLGSTLPKLGYEVQLYLSDAFKIILDAEIY